MNNYEYELRLRDKDYNLVDVIWQDKIRSSFSRGALDITRQITWDFWGLSIQTDLNFWKRLKDIYVWEVYLKGFWPIWQNLVYRWVVSNIEKTKWDNQATILEFLWMQTILSNVYFISQDWDKEFNYVGDMYTIINRIINQMNDYWYTNLSTWSLSVPDENISINISKNTCKEVLDKIADLFLNINRQLDKNDRLKFVNVNNMPTHNLSFWNEVTNIEEDNLYNEIVWKVNLEYADQNEDLQTITISDVTTKDEYALLSKETYKSKENIKTAYEANKAASNIVTRLNGPVKHLKLDIDLEKFNEAQAYNITRVNPGDKIDIRNIETELSSDIIEFWEQYKDLIIEKITYSENKAAFEIGFIENYTKSLFEDSQSAQEWPDQQTSVTTLDATNITTNSFVTNMNFITGAYESLDVYFQYWDDDQMLFETARSNFSDSWQYSITIDELDWTMLSWETTYYYKAVAVEGGTESIVAQWATKTVETEPVSINKGVVDNIEPNLSIQYTFNWLDAIDLSNLGAGENIEPSLSVQSTFIPGQYDPIEHTDKEYIQPIFESNLKEPSLLETTRQEAYIQPIFNSKLL